MVEILSQIKKIKHSPVSCSCSCKELTSASLTSHRFPLVEMVVVVIVVVVVDIVAFDAIPNYLSDNESNQRQIGCDNRDCDFTLLFFFLSDKIRHGVYWRRLLSLLSVRVLVLFCVCMHS